MREEDCKHLTWVKLYQELPLFECSDCKKFSNMPMTAKMASDNELND